MGMVPFNVCMFIQENISIRIRKNMYVFYPSLLDFSFFFFK